MPNLLDKETIESIYEKATDILATVGVKFELDSTRELFKKHGAKVDEKIVFISPTLLDRALALLPKARYTPAGNKRLVAASPFSNAPMIIDDITGQSRRGNIRDAIKMYQLAETCDLYESINPGVVDPEDNDGEDQYISQIAMMLKYSDKFPNLSLRATKASAKNGDIYTSAKKAIQLIKEIKGDDSAPVMGQGICPMAPLSYDEESLINLAVLVEEKQDVTIFPCTLSFMTGPESLLGLVVQDIALCLAGVGIFSGIYHPAGLGLISRGISKMSMALGYNGMAGNAGLAAAPILAGVLNHLYGIRTAFIFLGCLNLAGTLIMLCLPVVEPEGTKKAGTSGEGSLILGFAVLCVCMMLGGIAYRAITVILPAYLELHNPVLLDWIGRVNWMPASRNVVASALSSAVFVVGMFGQFLGGFAAQRFEPRRAYLIFHLTAMPLVLAMAFTTDLSLLIAAMGYVLFLLGMQPIENTLVARFTPDRLRHSAYGTKFILTFGVGSVAVHLVGWIKGMWSLSAVFVAMTAVSLAIVISILVLIRTTRNIVVEK